MHHDLSSLPLRLERVLRERVHGMVHTSLAQLTLSAYVVRENDGEPIDPQRFIADAGSAQWEPFPLGSSWGSPWSTVWFRIEGTVPVEAREQDSIEAVIELGWLDHSVGFQSEGLVYRADGSAIKALNPKNSWVPLRRADGQPEFDADGTFTLYLEAAANPLLLGVPPFIATPDGDKATAGKESIYTIPRAEICLRDKEIAAYAIDLEVLSQLAEHTHDGDPRRWTLLAAIEDSLNAYDSQRATETVGAAREILSHELSKPAHASAHQLTAVGHAHIDSAWLWPLRETKRKVARTVSNVLALMDRDEDFKYAMSTAQQFAWLEQSHPEIFARVKERVAQGRFIPVGGMWVESDTNMPGSEAFTRQLVHGKRYFMDTFGIETREVWLPDSFGYSAALPQLTRLAGNRWFLTQKISWNETNKFPHHTFWWEGIDGSKVFTHFPPADTYGAELTGKELHHAVENFRDKGRSSHSLIPFGYGDGGGGPTREMLERAHRTADLEGSPKVTIRSPQEFFADAEAEYTQAATWVGELYLELHRGTYTSQLATKQGNRRSEALLLEAEGLSAAATILTGASYPAEELDRIWKSVLLLQFHDILPGSSIAWVHREARETYAQVAQELRSLIDAARKALQDNGFDGDAALEHGAALDHGVASDTTVASVAAESEAGTGTYRIDNGLLSAVIDASGHVTSLRDLVAERELLVPGHSANVLQLHRDEPVMWDAWDVEARTLNRPVDVTQCDSIVPFTEQGRAGVEIRRTFSASNSVQRIWLEDGRAQLDCDLDIDWQEDEKLLKVSIPLALTTEHAQFETQYGFVTRTVHENTSWDAARFEVCQHRYLRIPEPGYAVAVVNDSSYGCDVVRSPRSSDQPRLTGAMTTARLSLLRAPHYPDPETDLGRHTMRWSILPSPTTMEAVVASRRINQTAALDNDISLVKIVPGERPTTGCVEAIKLADDGSGDVIVRVAEVAGAPTGLAVAPAFGFSDVVVTDLLERVVEGDAAQNVAPEVRRDQDVISLDLAPFQVVTLRLSPRS